jgi:hypothetical protein
VRALPIAARHRAASRATRRTLSGDEQPPHRDRRPPGASSSAYPVLATVKLTGACVGYVVDHIIPLKRGGLDAPSNMQWQMIAEAKAKDRVE